MKGTMKRTFSFTIFALMLGACAPLKQALEPASPQTSTGRAQGGEALYQVLIAELMAQRGEYAGAFDLLRPLVARTGDVQLAHRLFQLSMQTYDLKRIQAASELWHRLEPGNPVPLRALWLLALRQGKVDTAVRVFEQYQQVTPEPLEQDLQLAAERLAGAVPLKPALAFLDALGKRHDTWAVDFARGQVLLEKERPQPALAAFERALKRGGDAALIYPWLAKTYLALDQAQAGLARLKPYADRHPDNWQLQAEVARLQVEQGDFKGAEARFRQVLKVKPDADLARLALALLAFERGEDDMARKQFEKLLKNPITRPTALYYLGRLAERAGRLQEAAAWYQQVKHPKFQLDAYLRLVDIVRRLKGLPPALKLLDGIQGKTPQAKLKLKLARVALLRRGGREAEALAEARRLETLIGDDPDLLLQLSAELYELKAWDDYERVLEHVLTLAPDNADALNALGYFYVERNRNLDEAEKLLRRALKLRPDAYYIQDSMGWYYWRRGRLEEAAKWLRRALAQTPDEEVLAHLLRVEAARGDRAALEALHRRYEKLFKQSGRLRALWLKITGQAGQLRNDELK